MSDSSYQPPPPPPPPPGAYPPPGHPPQQPGYNVMAILSLVFAFVFAPVAIVLGHLAKKQIRTSGEQGEAIATVGLILGYIFTGLVVLACCGGLAAVIIGGATTTT